MQLSTQQTVGDLRALAAAAYEHPADYLELSTPAKDKPITDDSFYLGDLRAVKTTRYITVYVKKNPPPKVCLGNLWAICSILIRLTY